MSEEVVSQKDKVKRVGTLVQQIQGIHQNIDEAKTELDSKTRAIAELDSQMQLMTDLVVVESPGELPAEPSEDKRKLMAAAGFIGGGLLPVGDDAADRACSTAATATATRPTPR